MSALRPVALYLHIPYCARKCGYCDFNSYAGTRPDDQEAYVAALEREMELRAAALAPDVTVPTVFVGGGTPTLLAAELLARLIRRTGELFPVEPGAEFTVEANPGTIDLAGEKLGQARAAGANRISFGVQAFQDALLRRLDRLHSAGEAVQAVTAARQAGFTNLNLDLMYGLPGQTPEDFRRTVQQAIALGPEHVSAYSLIVEEGTPFFRLYEQGELSLPGEEDEDDMDALAWGTLAQAGYAKYEVSNYARPGYECRHNLIYWRNEEWLGLGAGAHSHLAHRRAWNLYRPDDYIRTVQTGVLPEAGAEEIDPTGEMAETMMLGLRTLAGVTEARFAGRFGRTLTDVYGTVGTRLERDGLLDRSGGAWRLTRRGLRLGNRVWAEFLP